MTFACDWFSGRFMLGHRRNDFDDNFNTSTLPTVHSNNVYAPSGIKYGGICADQTGMNGNISVNPTFVSNSNHRLKGGSPAIDAGSNAAPDLPSTDYAGNPRILAPRVSVSVYRPWAAPPAKL